MIGAFGLYADLAYLSLYVVSVAELVLMLIAKNNKQTKNNARNNLTKKGAPGGGLTRKLSKRANKGCGNFCLNKLFRSISRVSSFQTVFQGKTFRNYHHHVDCIFDVRTRYFAYFSF